MRKVGSNSSLSSLDGCKKTSQPGQLNKSNFSASSTLKGSSGPTHPAPAMRTSVKTQAFVSDMAMAPGPAITESELVYAISSTGIFTGGECLGHMLDEAPDLQGGIVKEAASCLAVPVLPDETNGELVNSQTNKLASAAEAQLRVRYANEIATNFASRPIGAPRLMRLLSRKRSIDDDMDIKLQMEIGIDETNRSSGRAEQREAEKAADNKHLLSTFIDMQLLDTQKRNTAVVAVTAVDNNNLIPSNSVEDLAGLAQADRVFVEPTDEPDGNIVRFARRKARRMSCETTV